MKTRIAREGCWLTYAEPKPIGEWEWFLRVDCPNSVDIDAAYIDEPNASKEAREKEQDEWLAAQAEAQAEQSE